MPIPAPETEYDRWLRSTRMAPGRAGNFLTGGSAVPAPPTLGQDKGLIDSALDLRSKITGAFDPRSLGEKGMQLAIDTGIVPHPRTWMSPEAATSIRSGMQGAEDLMGKYLSPSIVDHPGTRGYDRSGNLVYHEPPPPLPWGFIGGGPGAAGEPVTPGAAKSKPRPGRKPKAPTTESAPPAIGMPPGVEPPPHVLANAVSDVTEAGVRTIKMKDGGTWQGIAGTAQAATAAAPTAPASVPATGTPVPDYLAIGKHLTIESGGNPAALADDVLIGYGKDAVATGAWPPKTLTTTTAAPTQPVVVPPPQGTAAPTAPTAPLPTGPAPTAPLPSPTPTAPVPAPVATPPVTVTPPPAASTPAPVVNPPSGIGIPSTPGNPVNLNPPPPGIAIPSGVGIPGQSSGNVNPGNAFGVKPPPGAQPVVNQQPTPATGAAPAANAAAPGAAGTNPPVVVKPHWWNNPKKLGIAGAGVAGTIGAMGLSNIVDDIGVRPPGSVSHPAPASDAGPGGMTVPPPPAANSPFGNDPMLEAKARENARIAADIAPAQTMEANVTLPPPPVVPAPPGVAPFQDPRLSIQPMSPVSMLGLDTQDLDTMRQALLLNARLGRPLQRMMAVQASSPEYQAEVNRAAMAAQAALGQSRYEALSRANVGENMARMQGYGSQVQGMVGGYDPYVQSIARQNVGKWTADAAKQAQVLQMITGLQTAGMAADVQKQTLFADQMQKNIANRVELIKAEPDPDRRSSMMNQLVGELNMMSSQNAVAMGIPQFPIQKPVGLANVVDPVLGFDAATVRQFKNLPFQTKVATLMKTPIPGHPNGVQDQATAEAIASRYSGTFSRAMRFGLPQLLYSGGNWLSGGSALRPWMTAID